VDWAHYVHDLELGEDLYIQGTGGNSLLDFDQAIWGKIPDTNRQGGGANITNASMKLAYIAMFEIQQRIKEYRRTKGTMAGQFPTCIPESTWFRIAVACQGAFTGGDTAKFAQRRLVNIRPQGLAEPIPDDLAAQPEGGKVSIETPDDVSQEVDLPMMDA
jgi:hypothetical protein